MNILVLDDGFKGNLNQSLGIAEAFPESRIEILKVSLKGPYYRLFQRKGKSPFVSRLFALSCCIRAWSLGRRLLQFFCDGNIEIPREKSYVIVSAGSILAPVNLILSKNQERAVSVNVMVPTSLPLKLFDFLVIPCHDYIKLKRKRLKNLIVTLGAPNRITETFISGEKKRIEKLLNFDNGKKNIGILIGGNDQNYRISLPLVKRLADILFSCDGKYSFLFTTSRRTETCVVNYLVKRLEKEKSVVYSEFPGYSDISYYPGILGLCDCILVTEDSINMISEAASSGVPVIILGVERKNRKKLVFDFTIEKFMEKGYAEYVAKDRYEILINAIDDAGKKTCVKLRESEICVQKILENMK